MKILFTGSNGFVSKHLIPKFKKNNKIIYCDLPKLDINNFKKIYNHVKKNKPDLIIHTAAAKGALKSNINPKKYINTNAFGTLNICESMRQLNIKKIIYISSCSFYKRKQKELIETDPDDFNNPYGFGKFLGEKIISFYSHKYKFWSLCLRPNLISGMGLKDDNLIYDIIKEILEKDTATVFDKGNHVREFIHPLDFYEAIMAWLRKKNKPNYCSYNISANRYKIIDVIKRIIKILNKGVIKFRNKNSRVFSVKLSSKNIKKDLKLKSRYDLNYIIKDNYEKFK